MAKSDETLDRIDTESAYQEQTNPSWAKMKQINAFDTETSDGTVFMLSYVIGDNDGIIANHDINELSSKKIFNKITDYGCRSAINIWYNLDFDANAILSGILNTRELTELKITNGTTTEVEGIEYEIRYVKGKFLRIKDEYRNIYPHYDISQFFYTSLDNAAEEWLGENKIEEIDTEKFGSQACDNHETPNQYCNNCWNIEQAHNYIQNNFHTIVDYAVKDAKLTQRLANELIQEGESLDIPMGQPISTGYLSAEYLRANVDKKPSFHHEGMQSMFWDAYYGGRFEVFKRGNVGEIAAPDINSAYPAIMQKLPNPSTMKWERKCNTMDDDFGFNTEPFSFEDICKADYGVVKAIVTTDPQEPIQPFAYKIDGKVNYPILTDNEITTIKPIFEFAVKNGLVKDYQLLESWLGYETENTEYPFDFIGDIYAQRKIFEHLDNKPKKGQLLKIVLNSLYGKTCQTTELKEIINLEGKGQIELEKYQQIQPKDFISLNEREVLGDNEIIVGTQVSGKRFNPFFAAYITGMTRLELHKQVVEHDLVDETVMFATDCLMVEREAYEKSDFDQLIKVPDESLDREEFRQVAKESLGYWDFDYKGKGFVVGSGVYEVERENGKTKTKTRGYIENNLDGTLKELAKQHPEGIPIKNERPLTIGEVLISPKRGNVSQFVKNSKTLRPDFDTKRNWQREDVTFHQLLEWSESSEPINLIELQEKRMQEAQEAREKPELPEQIEYKT